MLRALTVRAVVAVAVAVVAGCGTGAATAPPPSVAGPSAAELVRDAQQALRTAGTGHFDHSALALTDGGEWVPWQQAVGDYDLGRQVLTREERVSSGGEDPRVAGWNHTLFVVATAGVEYATSDQWGETGGRRWHRVRRGLGAAGSPYFEIGTPSAVSAVLAFRPDDTEPDDDGDSWTVSGTLPVPVALTMVAAVSGESGESGAPDPRLLLATGTASARLVVGADRTVRELHVAGVDIDVTSELATDTLQLLPRQAGTITLIAYGKPVTVRLPPPAQVTDAPMPSFSRP